MAVAETANLLVKLSLGGNYASQLTKAQRQFQTLGKGLTDTQGRAYKAGQQIGTGIKRGAFIAIGALTALTGYLAVAVKQGQEAANVQKVYAQAIANSGKVSADYVGVLNAQQKALENLAGVDDELIKTEQTRLIQMGLTGKATAALTPLILDAAKATGKDLLTVTIAAGKAANGNATALQRLGIQVDKTKFKIDPLAETIRVLNQRFGGTTKALSGSLDVRLAALRESFNDIGENVGQQLLPALTRIVDVVGRKVVPAFGKFVDRILPEVIKGVDQFASLLENGGAERGINAITSALIPLVQLVKIAAAPVKAIVGAFLSLPSQVQTVLIGAFAVNKLTGGLVTNVFGGIAEAIAKSFIRAPLVNVQGGVVNVAGGIPGVGGGVPGGGGGILGTAKNLVVPVAIAAVTVEAAGAIGKAIDPTLGTALNDPSGAHGTPLFNRDPRRFNSSGQVVTNVAPVVHAVNRIVPAVLDVGDGVGKMSASVVGAIGKYGQSAEGKLAAAAARDAETSSAIHDNIGATEAAGRRAEAGARAGGAAAAAAIRAKDLSVTVPVKVSSSVTVNSVTKHTTIIKRYGRVTGSHGDFRELG